MMMMMTMMGEIECKQKAKRDVDVSQEEGKR